MSKLKQAVLFASASLVATSALPTVTDIDSAELARLAASGVTVIDIRTAGEWQETGVIAGSKLLTFFDEKGRADPPLWLEKVKAVARPEQPVILICRSGNRTRAASQFLDGQAGYKTVYNVAKGIGAWTREGRPLVPSGSTVAGCAADAKC